MVRLGCAPDAPGGCWSGSGLGTAVTHPKPTEARERCLLTQPSSRKALSFSLLHLMDHTGGASRDTGAPSQHGWSACGPHHCPGLSELVLLTMPGGAGEQSRVSRHARVSQGLSRYVPGLSSCLGEADGVGDHVEAVPGEELPLSGVVVHHAEVAEAVLEGDAEGSAGAGGRVIGKVDGGVRC